MDYISIEENMDEYLTVRITTEFKVNTQRIYYLHEQDYLTCFKDVKDHQLFYLDYYEKKKLKDCLKKQNMNKEKMITLLKKMITHFESLSNEMIISNLNYVYCNEDINSIVLAKLPIYIESYSNKDAFLEFCFALFEEMNFEGDDAWLSRLYLLLKRKPFSFSNIIAFLDKKEEKKGWFSFLKASTKEDDFFETFIVKEQEENYPQELNSATTILDMKTEILFSGVNYGFLEDENKNVIFLSPVPYMIGRLKECQLCLEARDISKKHARINIDELGLFIEDLNSTNGTKINGQKIEKHYLNDLDKIEISSSIFIYHKGE